MASTSANPPSEFFTSLSRNYACQTGNSTRSILELSIGLISPRITSSAIVHDNAGGVGTATSVILDHLGAKSPDDVPEILITDNNPAMVGSVREAFKEYGSRISVSETDSQDLGRIPDAYFTHTILSFSIFLFPNALTALREIHRTLKPDGVAVLTTWKHFGFASVTEVARALVRPDLPPMPLPGSQFREEGVLGKLAIEAGIDTTKMKVVQKETVRTGQDVQGMKEFMLSQFSTMATKGWDDDDKAKWPMAVTNSIEKQVQDSGGIKFEAWVIIAKK